MEVLSACVITVFNYWEVCVKQQNLITHLPVCEAETEIYYYCGLLI